MDTCWAATRRLPSERESCTHETPASGVEWGWDKSIFSASPHSEDRCGRTCPIISTHRYCLLQYPHWFLQPIPTLLMTLFRSSFHSLSNLASVSNTPLTVTVAFKPGRLRCVPVLSGQLPGCSASWNPPSPGCALPPASAHSPRRPPVSQLQFFHLPLS